MKYTDIRNPKWSNPGHTIFHCEVNFERLGWLPFAPSPEDIEEHSKEIFERVVSGEFGPIADYVKQADELPGAMPSEPQQAPVIA